MSSYSIVCITKKSSTVFGGDLEIVSPDFTNISEEYIK
jgi:hypothetical protein